MTDASWRPRLVIADGRGRTHPVLRAIFECSAVHHDVQVVASAEHAPEVVSAVAPIAVLIHAEIDQRAGMPAFGPLLAAILRRHAPELPLLLYTGSILAGHEVALAQLAIRAPVVFDQRLAESLDSIVRDLVDHATAAAELRRAPQAAPRPLEDRLPAGFLLERFRGQVETALMRASLHEHPDRTEAAAVLRVPYETFVAHMGQHDVEIPDVSRPASVSQPRLLWCSGKTPPESVTKSCDDEDVCIRCVQPGMLHPASVLSNATIAAVVEPSDASSAADVWLLYRSVRPFVLAGSIPPPVRFLLEELGVHECATTAGRQVPASLIRAGRCAANLYRDEQLAKRLPYRPNGPAAWPFDLPNLLLRLDGPVLRLARRTSDTAEAAARAVGLSDRTFRRRLCAANLRDVAR